MPPSVYVPGLLTLMPWLRARGDLVPCWRRRRPNVILIASPPISSWLHPTAHVNMDHNCIEQQINANDGYLLPKGLDNERSQADGVLVKDGLAAARRLGHMAMAYGQSLATEWVGITVAPV